MKIVTSVQGLQSSDRFNSAYSVDKEFCFWATKFSHQVCVICPETNYFEEVCHRLSLRVKLPTSLKRLALIITSAVVFIRFYKKDPNIIFRVNCFFSDILAIIPLLLFSRARVKFFIQFHHKDPSRLKNLIYRLIIPYSGVVFCPSQAASNECRQIAKIPNNKIFVVKHGVNSKYFDISHRRQIRPENDLKILYVGLINQRKNTLALCDIVKVLKDKGYNFHLDVIGDGPLKILVQNRINELEINAFMGLRGEVSELEKDKYYMHADVFLFPTMQEGFGLVIAEALAAGVPIVGYNISSLPEIVDENCGILCPVGDIEAMSNALISFINDRERLIEMGKCSVENATKHFNWEKKIYLILEKLDTEFPTKKAT